MIYLCNMKNIITDHIRELLSQRVEKATMVIHPISLDKFLGEVQDPRVYLDIIEQISLGEAAKVNMYGLNITIYRSFDIPKNEIILHEQTN